MEEKDDELQTNFGDTRCSIRGEGALIGASCHRWAPLGTACSWEPPTILNPHFVAGEHGLFGAHESEDIRTILVIILCVT